jgi:hypothetical protein
MISSVEILSSSMFFQAFSKKRLEFDVLSGLLLLLESDWLPLNFVPPDLSLARKNLKLSKLFLVRLFVEKVLCLPQKILLGMGP